MIGEVFLERVVERGIELAYTHRGGARALLSFSTLHRGTELRVSFAELLRLSRNDSFLLVRGRRRSQSFGPLGGVIQYFPAARAEILDGIGFQDQLPTFGQPCDLRGHTRGKHLGRLLRWFYSGKHVEKNALAREIREELAEAGLKRFVSKIPALEFDLVRIVHEGPTRVPGQNFLQYRLFHVFELEAGHPASQGFAELLAQCAQDSPNLLFASRSEILKGRARTGELIGDQSGYLFGSKRAGLEPASF